jgi:hypothetical protein
VAPRQAHRPRRRITSLRATTLAATVALALSAATCSDDEDDADGASSTTEPANSTSTTLSVEEEVEAAYLAFWDMFIRLAQAPNPDDPEIAQRASGETRGNLVDGFTTQQSLNRRSEFGPEYRHEVLNVTTQGDTAVIEDCAVDDSRIVDVATGETVEEDIVTELLNVTLMRRGDTWSVNSSVRVDAWDGAVECH